jgi:hypothetical protein
MPRYPLALGTIMLFLVGCSSLEPHIGQQVLYRDPAIHLARPNIIKAPQDHAPRPFVAVIRPFRLLQRVHDPSVVELGITKVVADRFSGDRVFLQLHREWTNRHPTALEADLVVTGTISHLLVGGDKGTTAVGLMVEIHDARTGEPLWTITHAAHLTPGTDKDYILVRTTPRPPLDPVYAVTDRLAGDLGRLVGKWNWAGLPPRPMENPYVEEEPTLIERVGHWVSRLGKEEN